MAQRWIYEVKLMPIECQISGLRDGEWCPIEKLNLETGGVPQGLVVGGGVEARSREIFNRINQPGLHLHFNELILVTRSQYENLQTQNQ